MKIKLVGVFTAIVLAFVFLTGRAAALNLTKGDEYQKQVMSQMRSGSQTIPFKRGDILDTNGTAHLDWMSRSSGRFCRIRRTADMSY